MDAATMGSFKGVMLCNRPTQIQGSLQAKTGGDSTAQKPSFVSTVSPAEQIGLNPIPKEYPDQPLQDEEQDVTFRHKKWLEEFQNRRDEMTELLEDEVVQQEDARKKFQEKEAAKRAAIRAVKKKTDDPEAIERAFSGTATAEDLKDVEEAKEQEPEEKTSNNNIKVKSSKPKWAMTEEEAEDADDAELDELLDFANNLDYDSYIDDLDVKEALKFIHKRVQQLEAGMPPIAEEGLSEEEMENRRVQWEEDKRKAREVLERTRQKWLDEGNEPLALGDMDDLMSESGSVSSRDVLGGGNLKQVHSAQSVENLMKNLAVEPPVITVSKPFKLASGVDPSNLPYLHRNPAV